MNKRVDAIVIGSGPGGEGTAMQLAKHGKKVLLAERFSKVGGGCTHWGTIPSKALRVSISQLLKLLKMDPVAFKLLNDQRESRELPRLM